MRRVRAGWEPEVLAGGGERESKWADLAAREVLRIVLLLPLSGAKISSFFCEIYPNPFLKLCLKSVFEKQNTFQFYDMDREEACFIQYPRDCSINPR